MCARARVPRNPTGARTRAHALGLPAHGGGDRLLRPRSGGAPSPLCCPRTRLAGVPERGPSQLRGFQEETLRERERPPGPAGRETEPVPHAAPRAAGHLGGRGWSERSGPGAPAGRCAHSRRGGATRVRGAGRDPGGPHVELGSRAPSALSGVPWCWVGVARAPRTLCTCAREVHAWGADLPSPGEGALRHPFFMYPDGVRGPRRGSCQSPVRVPLSPGEPARREAGCGGPAPHCPGRGGGLPPDPEGSGSPRSRRAGSRPAPGP